MSALLIANSATFAFQLITTSFPKIKTLIICSHKVLFKRSQEIADMQALCAARGIEITPIHLPQQLKELVVEIQEHAPTAGALFMPIDSEAFSAMPDIIQMAQQYGCPVVASELLAIQYGADIAFGYPLQSFAAECARQLLHILQYQKRDIRFAKAVREIHCSSSKQDILLRALSTHKADYHFKIIGCINNEESEQGQ
ncbi:MAG: hypothetical protein QG632_802 [Candidatus Dependentiae bacterium]|nr:hypothetical protein [Candidatus Dependentiae bacterium]